jgi:hypothetical protein
LSAPRITWPKKTAHTAADKRQGCHTTGDLNRCCRIPSGAEHTRVWATSVTTGYPAVVHKVLRNRARVPSGHAWASDTAVTAQRTAASSHNPIALAPVALSTSTVNHEYCHGTDLSIATLDTPRVRDYHLDTQHAMSAPSRLTCGRLNRSTSASSPAQVTHLQQQLPCWDAADFSRSILAMTTWRLTTQAH